MKFILIFITIMIILNSLNVCFARKIKRITSGKKAHTKDIVDKSLFDNVVNHLTEISWINDPHYQNFYFNYEEAHNIHIENEDKFLSPEQAHDLVLQEQKQNDQKYNRFGKEVIRLKKELKIKKNQLGSENPEVNELRNKILIFY